MTKEEIRLLELIVSACTNALATSAGMVSELRDEYFGQIDQLNKALADVKATANTSARTLRKPRRGRR